VSRLDSTNKGRGVLVSKPKADIYTALLGIALAAILLGILFLCLEMRRYNWDYRAAVTMATPNQTLKGQTLKGGAVVQASFFEVSQTAV